MGHEAKAVAERLRAAEMELQFAQRAYDGSEQSRLRYARALQEMELAQRLANRFVRQESALFAG